MCDLGHGEEGVRGGTEIGPSRCAPRRSPTETLG